VYVRRFQFTPSSKRIRRGNAVRWVFVERGIAYNVRSRGRPAFKSSGPKRGGTYAVSFSGPGTYKYVCTRHRGMAGQVVVVR